MLQRTHVNICLIGGVSFAIAAMACFNLLLQIVTVFYGNMFEQLYIKHVNIDLWIHEISHECKSKLISWIESLQLIEHEAGEEFAWNVVPPND
jgi:hypothetical protein